MPNLEPNIPMTIKSSYGVVDINTPYSQISDGVSWLYLILNDDNDYAIVPGKFRATIDSVSQGDGSSIQPPYIDGLVATMTISYWTCPDGNCDDRQPACGEDLRLMDEYLMGVLNGLRTYPTDVSTQQYAWLPTGTNIKRLLEGVMLASWTTPDFSKGPPEVRRKISLGSPYPYALEDDLVTTDIADGTSETVTNGGNIETKPIIFIVGAGSSSVSTIVNTASGLTLKYDPTRPGAVPVPSAHSLQIDCAEGTCLLDGDPDLDYIAGLDPSASDFWSLLPNGPTSPSGEQVVSATGSDIQVKHYASWV